MRTDFPYKLVDLSHVITSMTPTWEGECGFRLTNILDYDVSELTHFCVQNIEMQAGMGTHIDAPAHCFKGLKTVEQIPLQLMKGVMIDVSIRSTPEYLISCEDIYNFESEHGALVDELFVLFRTGWDAHWKNSQDYRNNLVFPALSEKAALYLLKKNILGIGIDTLSPDRPSLGYPVHRILLGNNKLIVENVTNLDQLPPIGFFVGLFPLFIEGATESPARVTAFIP